MTVGSFVCTSCSGILRGLNPPHRVKSISMASFTPEEIEQIKSKGNQYCQAVWLGLYDPKSSPFPDTKDEHKIRDFMISKYEKKRFYIDPVVALKNMPPQTSSATSSNASTPNSETAKTGTSVSTSVSRPNVSASQSSSSVGGALPIANSGSKSTVPKSSASLALLADLGNQSSSAVSSNDPFASPTSTQTSNAMSQPSFANFENANIFTNTAKIPSTQILSSSSQPQKISSATPPPIAPPPPPRSCPSTRSPSPRQSPFRFSHWESFEESSAAMPLIPMSETSSIEIDTIGKEPNRGQNDPPTIYAAGVSAQFVCPTNTNFAACAREQGKLLSSSLPNQCFYTPTCTSDTSHGSSHVSTGYYSKYDSVPNEEGLDSSSSLLSRGDRDSGLKLQTESSLTLSHQESRKKQNQILKTDDKFTYSSLNTDQSLSRSVTPENENQQSSESTSGNYFNLNSKSNEITSKCFAAFLFSTSKISGTSYQNFGSENAKKDSVADKRFSGSINQDLDIEVGQVALELENLSTASEPRDIIGKSKSVDTFDDMSCSPTPVGSVVEMKTNPFLSVGDAVSGCVDDHSVFDNVPLFNKKKLDTSKPVSIVSSISAISASPSSSALSSSCPSMSTRASSCTNPFVSVLQPDTNVRQRPLEAVSSSGRLKEHQSSGVFSSSAVDVFLHDHMQGNRPSFNSDISHNSMTTTPYLLTGSTPSSKSTPSGAPPPFSNSPLTPMTPGSATTTSTNPNPSNISSQLSNLPAQDRYAALKDLDEEYKTQKESETIPS
ncbi:ArfGAP with FG repeats 1, partial [Halocaridina rubra]